VDVILRTGNFFLHIDVHLAELAERFGEVVYAILFAIVFAETGLVVTPFLPGDSLLFAAGTLAGAGVLDPLILGVTLLAAAILGDGVNYLIGRLFGQRLLAKPRRFIKPQHVARTQAFYERHGGKTIILARFVPFARTFAPFVAGVVRMDPARFLAFNVSGAVLWVGLFVGAGVLFGNVPWVKDNLTLVLALVVLVTVGPGLVAIARRRLAARRSRPAPSAPQVDPGAE
jgi:membrane-associated protein